MSFQTSCMVLVRDEQQQIELQKRLAWKLHQIKGFAMVSGYDCLLMDYLYDDWHKIKFPMKRNNIRSNIVNGSGTLMQECIWCNYEIPVRNQNLFLHETAYSI